MKDSAGESILLTALRDCICLHNTMNTNGLCDEKGALASVASLLDILSLKRKYGLVKTSDLKTVKTAERTMGVTLALSCGQAIRVEHIYTLQEWASCFIEKVDAGFTDGELLSFIDKHYRLVLVTLVQSRALRKLHIPFVGIARFEYIGLEMDTAVMHPYSSSALH